MRAPHIVVRVVVLGLGVHPLAQALVPIVQEVHRVPIVPVAMILVVHLVARQGVILPQISSM